MRSVLAGIMLTAMATAASADDEVATPAHAADKGTIGIGLQLGEPTGITAKIYLKDDQAVQVCAGSAFVAGGLEVDADYLFHPLILQTRDSFVMPLYVGPGLRAIDYRKGGGENAFAMGMRAVVGILFDFKEVPLDAYVEVGGVLQYRFQHDTGVMAGLDLGLGVRYYF